MHLPSRKNEVKGEAERIIFQTFGIFLTSTSEKINLLPFFSTAAGDVWSKSVPELFFALSTQIIRNGKLGSIAIQEISQPTQPSIILYMFQGENWN